VWALTALQSAGQLRTEAIRDALVFLARCQSSLPAEAGGFHFTVRPEDPLNKAGMTTVETRREARPYASATCDGVLSLLACNVPIDDPRISYALSYLDQNLPVEPRTGFRQWLRFYESQSLGAVCRQIPSPLRRLAQRRNVEMLQRDQQVDGSWVNLRSEMREDDPLIATSFAIRTLS